MAIIPASQQHDNKDFEMCCCKLQRNNQLHHEIDQYLQDETNLMPSSKIGNPCLRLPSEVSQQIFSYLLVVPESIHVYSISTYGNRGFRLSRCPESHINYEDGSCKCREGRRDNHEPTNRDLYMDTSLFMVSWTVRQQAMDTFYLGNRFTFTQMDDLHDFLAAFPYSAGMIRDLCVFSTLYDGEEVYRMSRQIVTRKLLGQLKSLTIHARLYAYMGYEKQYVDGYVKNLMHFCFPPPADSVCFIWPSRRSRDDKDLCTAEKEVQSKLGDILAGAYPNADSVPIDEPPLIPAEEKRPLAVKRGFLALGWPAD